MSFILGLLGGPLKLWIIGGLVAAALAFVGWQVHVQREIGREEIRDEWRVVNARQIAANLAQSEANAKETFRRIEAQQENDRVKEQQLAAARRDADRNAADADRLRAQQADIARRWRDALADSPTPSQCEAAGEAIVLQADVLARLDRRAGELARFADTAYAIGVGCDADYDALTVKP